MQYKRKTNVQPPNFLTILPFVLLFDFYLGLEGILKQNISGVQMKELNFTISTVKIEFEQSPQRPIFYFKQFIR